MMKKREERQREAEWGESDNGERMSDSMRTEEVYYEGKGRRKRGYRLTGSELAKIVAFFLLGISSLVGIWATVGCAYIGSYGFYTDSLDEVIQDTLSGPSRSIAYRVAQYLEAGNLEGAEEVCRGTNADVAVMRLDETGHATVIWSTWDGYDTAFMTDVYFTFEDSPELKLGGHELQKNKPYLIRTYLKPDFPEEDEFRTLLRLVRYIYECRYGLIGVAAGGILLFISCFLFLMCSAGHRNGQRGVVPGVLTGIPVDVLTVLFGGIALFLVYALASVGRSLGDFGEAVLVSVAGLFLLIWGTIYCMDLAIRLKMGKCFRNSLIFLVLRGSWRFLRLVCRGTAGLVRGIPLIWTTLIGYFGICFLEMIGVSIYVWEQEGIMLWLLEKIILLPVVLYIALACKRLLRAGRALASGQDDYKVDTSRLIGNFREHGENLNSLGEGISRAVAERLRSERLKTELITNVSHDLKTPLTSIINYADLIYEEASGGSTAKQGRSAGVGGNQSAGGAGGSGDAEKRGTERAADSYAGGAEDGGNLYIKGEQDSASLHTRGAEGGENPYAEEVEDGTNLYAGGTEDSASLHAEGIEDNLGLYAERTGETEEPSAQEGEKGADGADGAAPMAEADKSGPDSAANARIAEYSEVLLRQSRRLKKLLEDLLEASKATTGNLEVSLEPCEVGVLLSQAVGEYQQRMEEKRLELIARQPQEPVHIMADGRHLWRVFDNLLNNICKYAQEGTRVYLSVEAGDGYVRIIFRNMSKYALDISAEELEERFVRGDRSRHMEGNGLGLSIARSLVDLQGGRMEITIDGDLFKNVLVFAQI